MAQDVFPMVQKLTIVESIWQNVSKTPCTCWCPIHVHVHVDDYIYMYIYMYMITCICTCTWLHVHVHVRDKRLNQFILIITQPFYVGNYILNLVLSLSPDLLIEFKNISERPFESSCLHRSHMHMYHCSLKNYFFTTNFDTSSPPLLLLITISMCNYMYTLYILYIHDYMYIICTTRNVKVEGGM